MTDIRAQVLKNNIGLIPFATIDAKQGNCILEAMDEYAILILEYVRKDYNFSETYITDLKAYLEEIKTELK